MPEKAWIMKTPWEKEKDMEAVLFFGTFSFGLLLDYHHRAVILRYKTSFGSVK